MNTNGLAKLYGQLTPKERLPLILAASARGDEAERNRLAQSAPKEGFWLPDYHGLAEGMLFASLFQLLEVLDMAAYYWRSVGLLEQEEILGDNTNKELRDRFDGLTRIYAYMFIVKIDGWRLFCARHNYDPDLLWKGLPGFETVCRGEEEIRTMAFTPEKADEWAKRGRKDAPRLARPEDEAAAIEVLAKSHAQWWD
jgi:hypothetical protein